MAQNVPAFLHAVVCCVCSECARFESLFARVLRDPVRAAGDWLCLSSSLVRVLSLRDTQRPSRPMVGSNVASGKEPSCQAGLARRKREPTHVEAIERAGSSQYTATGTPASK